MSLSGFSIAGRRDADPETGGVTARCRSRRVLIVEDDFAIRSSLSEALRQDGFEVLTAPNGHAALETLRRGPAPSAILLDLMMPVMDGWDFRHEQLKDPAVKDVPIVVITATGFSIETVRTQFGNVALVPKPIAYAELLRALSRLC